MHTVGRRYGWTVHGLTVSRLDEYMVERLLIYVVRRTYGWTDVWMYGWRVGRLTLDGWTAIWTGFHTTLQFDHVAPKCLIHSTS